MSKYSVPYLTAKRLVDYVEEQGRGRNLITYSFHTITNPPSVTLNLEDYSVKTCTCRNCSINLKNNPKCRYKQAVIEFVKTKELNRSKDKNV